MPYSYELVPEPQHRVLLDSSQYVRHRYTLREGLRSVLFDVVRWSVDIDIAKRSLADKTRPASDLD